jgi:hypothetical protein
MTAAAIASITVSPKRGNDSSTIIRRLNEQAKVTMVNKLVQSVGAPIHLPLGIILYFYYKRPLSSGDK